MKSYSGKFVLRIPPELHERLARQAETEGLSLNEMCRLILRQRLSPSATARSWTRPIDPMIVKIKRRFGPDLVGVILFGSQVSGHATEKSDLDLLVVLETDYPLDRSLYRWWEQSIRQGGLPEVNPHFVRYPDGIQRTGGLWLEVALNHEILYQKGRRMDRLFEVLFPLIGSGRVRREWSYGHPYWVWSDR